jgi:hypothetical protein
MEIFFSARPIGPTWNDPSIANPSSLCQGTNPIRLRIADCKFGIERNRKCGMGNAECGMEAFPNKIRHFPIAKYFFISFCILHSANFLLDSRERVKIYFSIWSD